MERAAAVAIAVLGTAVALAPSVAGAANDLSMYDARHKAQKEVRREHCPEVCFSSVVRTCQRISSRQVLCKGITHYPISDTAERRCKGKVRVTRRSSGRIGVKSIGWDCKRVA